MASQRAVGRLQRPRLLETVWRAADPAAAVAALAAALPEGAVQWRAARTERLWFYDTYDWELTFAGLSVIRYGPSLLLCPAGQWQARRALARQHLGTRSPERPPELVDGPLAAAVAAHVGERPLLVQGLVRRRVTPATLRAADGQLLARLALEAYDPPPASGRPPFMLLRWSAVEPAGGGLKRFIHDPAAVGLTRLGKADLRALPQALLAVPTREALRPRVCALSGEAAHTVVLRLALALLAALRRYEDGICRGLDAECLHQYRVGLRRLRTLLSQMRGALPAGLAVALRTSLGELAARTGRLRDLDVLLLAEPAYRRLVAPALQAGLTQAFARARRQRGAERRRLVHYVRSQGYAALLDELGAAMVAAAAAPGPVGADVGVARLVRRRLRRQYRRIVEVAAALPAAAPDESYHRMRVRCKRMRYILDLFQGILRAGPAAVLLKRLQGLQEELGAVNDLAVQRAHFAGLLALEGDVAEADPAALALADLRQRLDRRRAKLDRRVRVLLCRFCGPTTAQAVGKV